MENINAVPNATANAEESKTMNPTPIADRIAAVLADLTALGIEWNGQAAPKGADRIKLRKYDRLAQAIEVVTMRGLVCKVRDGAKNGPVLTIRPPHTGREYMNQLARRNKATCECADPGCPVHRDRSSCTRKAHSTVYRVDMVDRTGTRMCASNSFVSSCDVLARVLL